MGNAVFASDEDHRGRTPLGGVDAVCVQTESVKEPTEGYVDWPARVPHSRIVSSTADKLLQRPYRRLAGSANR